VRVGLEREPNAEKRALLDSEVHFRVDALKRVDFGAVSTGARRKTAPGRFWQVLLSGAILASAFLHGEQSVPLRVAVPDAARSTMTAVRTAEPPVIDGRLSDDVWEQAPSVDHFLQRDPVEGAPASERTEIRVLFDVDALYVGARLYDEEPGAISARLGSRDSWPDADHITVLLDPRHDHRTGVQFTVTAAGVQRDSVISNDTFTDDSWDAVWSSAVSRDDQGWSAELRIPFSQLRVSAGAAGTWGINVSRFIRRKNETVWLELWPKNDNGLASRMMHLSGVGDVRPRRRLELAPYVAARQEYLESDAGNPFNDGSRFAGSVGVDAKASVPGGLVLDLTINPDFGQAEVDPAVVNLTAYETFFPEKRRFFIDGAEIFNNFGEGGSNSFFGFNTSNPNLFYSRRIGRAPAVSIDGDFVAAPVSTTILGAAKLTGKTSNGWSVGVVEALTGREHARHVTDAVRGSTLVQPLTNLFVGRLQREFARGGAGVLTTSVIRELDTPLLANELTRRALVIGGDAYYFLDSRKDWVLTGAASVSSVSGTTRAIEDLQRSSQRYYQRPDAPHVEVDPARTGLSGYSGRVFLNRNSGIWRVNASLWGVSPGFDSNDLGFHSRGDRAGAHGVLLWNQPTPNRFTRSRGWWIAKAWTWNFNREVLNDIWMGCANAVFTSYWRANTCFGHSYRALQDDLTRGGPIAESPRGNWANIGMGTDGRKWLSFDGWLGHDWNKYSGFSTNANLTMTLKPLPSLSISTGPSLGRSRNLSQYLETEEDPTAGDTFGARYVFGTIEQKSLTLQTRVNWILNPNVSLQVYMQPLLATGTYGDFKELAEPRTYRFRHYADAGSTLIYDAAAREYTADPDASGPAPAFTFDNPDFNVKSLRLNAILRWEFRPGSTLYAVWTEQREDDSHPGDFRAGRDLARLFGAHANDVFLLKLTYWLGR
jgi:hypothetical protein